MKYTIHFPADGRRVAVAPGTTLLEARIAAGYPVDAPCGGRGTCGKCAVEYRRAGEETFVRALACQTRVDGDMEIRQPSEGSAMPVMIDGEGASSAALNPVARAVHLRVRPCPRGESVSDWTRLCEALDGALGHRPWAPSVPVCRGLGALLNRTRGDIWAVVSLDRVLEVAAEPLRVCMAAFDLGTTTIAGYLIDAATGATLTTCGARNPQAQYGADVISRADHALAHGVEALSDCARKAIDGLVGDMCAEAGIERDRIFAVMLAGNTAMHHLFFGISPDSLVRAPYNPVISGPLSVGAAGCGLAVHPEARLYALPVIGGYVGADTVACLISGDWMRRTHTTLMIDIGTNGELVLGDSTRRLACSTAAGPALEGAKIACGMRAADGAIDRVWLEDGALRWHVIGGGAARGLCGSGLVDLIAMLLACGAMDESGRLEGGDRLALGDTGVCLTQKDVREVQLAKAAIAAGISLMCDRMGIGLEDIDEVDIAGAFGNYINPDNACAIGLIPPALRNRIRQVGNAAGEGARLALLDADRWTDAVALAGGTTFLELATMPEFQDEFVEQLTFGDDDD